MTHRSYLVALVAGVFFASTASAVTAAATLRAADGRQAPDAAKPPAEQEGSGASATAQDQPDEDLEPSRAHPDFTIVTLPTSLRLPRFKSAFRLTHRFTRPLGRGDFGDLLEDFFGFDTGALIGLEFRFAPVRGGQIGIHRLSDRTIEFFGQYDVVRQREATPVGLAIYGTVEGADNFREQYSPGIGVIISRTVGERAALYAEPVFVGNTNPLPEELAADNGTFMLGLGARLRVRPSVYLVGEWTPRLGGFDPGVDHKTFGIEKRVGGHVFQVNFSNSLGTSLGGVARGGFTDDDWFIGFNISRKFF